jgi:RNA polymerase sigma-70 factor (ECF subfamily)
MHPDEKLMTEVRGGNLNKMSILFERYHVRLYNYFTKLTRDRALSEDLTQTVFERAIKYRNSYKDSYPFKAWIYRIASNVRYDHYRSQKLKVVYDDGYQEPGGRMDIDPGNDHGDERIDKLYKAMQKLNDEQKKMIWLTKYEGMKYSEAAGILGCTESALKVKIHRAMKSLKSNYFKYEQS